MTFDRSKYKPAAVAAVVEQQSTVEDATNNYKSGAKDWVEVKEGINKFRIFPAHEGTKDNLYIFPKVVNWLPIQVWVEKGDAKKKEVKETEVEKNPAKYEQIIKNKPIFNSKVHGNTPKDLVEEYSKFAVAHFKDQFSDKKDLDKKLFAILDWQKGIGAKTTYICYAKKVGVDGSSTFGRLEINKSVKDALNILSNRESENGAIVMDPFTHPDSGKAIQVKWDKNEPDNKKKYTTTLLWENNWPLSDEELIKFEESYDKLEDIYTNCYKRTDFAKQLAGLELLDAEHKYNLFTHDAWLDIVEEISKYYEDERFNPKVIEQAEVSEDKAQNNNDISKYGDILDNMEKEELVRLITHLSLDYTPKGLTSKATIIENIRPLMAKELGMPIGNKFASEIEQIVKDFRNVTSETPSQENNTPLKEEKTSTIDGEATTNSSDKVSALKNKYKKN